VPCHHRGVRDRDRICRSGHRAPAGVAHRADLVRHFAGASTGMFPSTRMMPPQTQSIDAAMT